MLIAIGLYLVFAIGVACYFAWLCHRSTFLPSCGGNCLQGRQDCNCCPQ